MQALDSFFQSQLSAWEIASRNYQSLKQVETRSILFDGFEVKVQYNPERILSATAGAQPSGERPCPLCAANRSPQQKALPFLNLFSIMVNPYPIFDKHFTIAHNKHIPQHIQGTSFFLLELARQYPAYSVFYNGPHAGASIPGHLHLQAIPKGHLPVEKDALNMKKEALLIDNSGTSYYLCDYLRTCIVLESASDIWLMTLLEHSLWEILSMNTSNDEVMMNVVVSYEPSSKAWRVFVFPRKAHRPRQFYEQGEAQLLISPGTIDMAGIFIVPRREDYEKIDEEMIIDTYTQITARI